MSKLFRYYDNVEFQENYHSCQLNLWRMWKHQATLDPNTKSLYDKYCKQLLDYIEKNIELTKNQREIYYYIFKCGYDTKKTAKVIGKKRRTVQDYLYGWHWENIKKKGQFHGGIYKKVVDLINTTDDKKMRNIINKIKKIRRKEFEFLDKDDNESDLSKEIRKEFEEL